MFYGSVVSSPEWGMVKAISKMQQELLSVFLYLSIVAQVMGEDGTHLWSRVGELDSSIYQLDFYDES